MQARVGQKLLSRGSPVMGGSDQGYRNCCSMTISDALIQQLSGEKDSLLSRFVGLLCWKVDMRNGFHVNEKGGSICTWAVYIV